MIYKAPTSIKNQGT